MCEAMMFINDKKIKSTKSKYVKYFVWAFLVIGTIVAFITYGGIEEIDFFAGNDNGWIFLTEPYRYAIYFGVILLAFVMQLTLGNRGFCNSICWMAPFMIFGTKLSNLLRLPRLQLKPFKETCTGCNLCTKKCPMSLDVKTMVKSANMRNSECILCGECIDACPKNSISYALRVK